MQLFESKVCTCGQRRPISELTQRLYDPLLDPNAIASVTGVNRLQIVLLSNLSRYGSDLEAAMHKAVREMGRCRPCLAGSVCCELSAVCFSSFPELVRCFAVL